MLTAIALDRKSIVAETFHDDAKCLAWLEKYGLDRNIYFHVNPTTHDLSKKAEREDIAALEWLHVDIDPRAGENITEEQERALKLLSSAPLGVADPTVIVFSGGGYQGFWKLKEPFTIDGDPDRYEEAKRYNQQLEIIFGGDNCHNVDRIMRLPGTVNRPDSRKRKKGRVEALATVVEWHDDRVYDLSVFSPAPAVNKSPTGMEGESGQKVTISGNVVRLSSVDELPESVPGVCKVVIVQGTDPDSPEKFPSRSEALFYVCCELVRAGCSDDTIFSVITDPDFRISDSVLDKGSSKESYAKRQIGRARENAIHPKLRELNEKFAVIGDIGGRCRVISEVYDQSLKRTRISRQTFEDFRNRNLHIKIKVGEDKRGREVTKPMGHWWLEHENRRSYDSMVFSPRHPVPGAYNLWRGFSCDAVPGDCSLFLQHLKDNVCSGNDVHYNYLIGWMARAVQYPDMPGQVAVVLRGKRGTGKSYFANVFGKLFGRHFMPVSDPKHLVGSFNAHLRDVVVVFGDEAFFAGDKRHESVLKTLITEEMITVEAKGIDAETAANCIHLIMASNDQWVVPAGLDERRFFVLDIGDKVQGDTEYFSAIEKQLASGGREALLHRLMTMDLSQYEVRHVPFTVALQDQKIQSMSQEEEWWFTKLQTGQLLRRHTDWESEVIIEELMEDFLHYNRMWGITRKNSFARITKFLSRVCPGMARVRIGHAITIVGADGREISIGRPVAYRIGHLSHLRYHWDENFGGPYVWPSDGHPPVPFSLDYEPPKRESLGDADNNF